MRDEAEERADSEAVEVGARRCRDPEGVSLPAGYAARPATADDAASVAALINAFDRVQLEEPDETSAADVAGWWARFDLHRDSLLVFDPDGNLAACADVQRRKEATLDLDGYVHPGHTGRGLGSALLGWGEDEARRRRLRTMHVAVLAADSSARCLLESRGFAPVRHFYRMLIDLDGPPPPPDWPAGFELAMFRPGEEEILHAVTEEAFADHWGHEPRDLEHWRRTVFEQEWWDPSLVYVVRRGDEVVAAAMNAIRFGMGWIGTLGTRKRWRGRGLGRALLLEAFGELYRRGEKRIGLAVDSGNQTGATRLYESVGMRVAWQADVHEKHV